jgi:hypothetical protein
MFYRWLRIDKEGRQGLWRLYGWYSALMMCGSCVGIVTWALYMHWNANISKANVFIPNFPSLDIDEKAQTLMFLALFARFRAWFAVTYAIEFFCLSVAKLMVLERMSDFVSLGAGGTSKRWAVGGKMLMAAVVAGNLVGLAGNVAAAVQWQPVVEIWMEASADYAANKSDSANLLLLKGSTSNKLSIKTSSVQAFCEVAVLLLIVAAFAVVGVACVRRISSAFHGLDSATAMTADVKQLRWQIIGTTGVVFTTFLVRTAYATFYALALERQNYDDCPNNFIVCDICFNDWSRMETWIKRNPVFVLMVVLATKPLPLLVALWGMTSKRMRRQMQSSQRQSAKAKGSTLKQLLRN